MLKVDKLPFVNSRSLLFDLTEILLPKRLIFYTCFDCEGYALSDPFYRIEIEPLVSKLCRVIFQVARAGSQSRKVNYLKSSVYIFCICSIQIGSQYHSKEQLYMFQSWSAHPFYDIPTKSTKLHFTLFL